ncbi:DUF4157 domain-containing protein [Chroococcidiopsis sp [FACHB-1243]]|uniref:eCIS core domain-containing protein n=1 Tax=Chroococcidiopsis sp. [FACHB-1243] TaxID=2692781 RepID=UPI0018EFFDE9|nr:DUF4157 domain-containing protein [Chroococcidiopsis sp. [FACHB-1243]]
MAPVLTQRHSSSPHAQQDTESHVIQQHQREATVLKIQAKHGTITPEGQERLTFLQAKMADEMQRKLDVANRTHQNSLNSFPGDVSVAPPERKAMPPIQAKLTIGQPGDKYEQEADRVAAQVVNQINAPTTQREALPEEHELQMKPEIGSIQRQAMPEDEELQMKSTGAGMTASQDLETSIQQARGSGQPLADSIKQPMEQAFGTDFSGVKVHTDAQSHQLNQSIQARAFTTGQDVFFRQGEYNPGSRGGQELLAHELTHVVQQNGGAVQRDRLQKAEEVKAENEVPQITVTKYETGLLNNGPFFEHIYFSDGSFWSTKIVSSGEYRGKHVYLDIREGLHKGEGYTEKDDKKGYKAQEVKNWLLGLHPDLKNHWTAYRQAAT